MSRACRWEALLGAAALALIGAAPAPLVRGLDHIPVAVNDLARAAADYRRLGFVLKPGRHHDDGIRNAHVKFADGTELELIAASHPSDALAAEYAAFLAGGDGPESWSLYSPDLAALTSRLTRLGFAPKDDEIVTLGRNARTESLFFADREPSPTDRPAYFKHPNTAYRLRAIWLTAPATERELIVALGATRKRVATCAPFAASAEELALADGEVFVIATDRGSVSRPIAGATVMVHRLDALRRLLDRNHRAYEERADCGHRSLWIPPAEAHGIWLEFRQ